eukprot:s2453_g13.t1
MEEACKTKESSKTWKSTQLDFVPAQQIPTGARCLGHYDCDGEDDTASLPRSYLLAGLAVLPCVAVCVALTFFIDEIGSSRMDFPLPTLVPVVPLPPWKDVP